jgi:PQQ-dependent catabolism-associated CXXCW motif protein
MRAIFLSALSICLLFTSSYPGFLKIDGAYARADPTDSFAPEVAGQGRRCYFGECENSEPASRGNVLPSPPEPGPRAHSSRAPVQRPREPNPIHNYADEFTDFGLAPQNTLQTLLATPTPISIPDGRVVATDMLARDILKTLKTRHGFILIDALGDRHPTIPGAYRIPYAGMLGSFDDQTQSQLWNQLRVLTNGRPGTPLIFFCESSKCWESYNAALRAMRMSFSNVFWYRGGLYAWRAAGLPLQ